MKINHLFSFVWVILGIVFTHNTCVATPISHIEISPISNSKVHYGQLKLVEDAGYPFVVLTIELAEGSTEIFNLNLETNTSVSMKKLNSWISQEVMFDFNTETSNDLLEITRGGKSIFSPDGFTRTDDTKTIKGIFSGAETETTGDMPSEVYVTTEEEYKLSFEVFITPELVDANGSEVTVFYEERFRNNITFINIAK